MSIKKKSDFLAVFSLVAVCFWLTGQEYLTWWLFRLPTLFDDAITDLFARSAAYGCQALGILLFSLAAKKSERLLCRPALAAILAVNGALAAAVVLSAAPAPVLIFGFLMNISIGMIYAYCLCRLCKAAPRHTRGRILGLGCAAGCAGAWLVWYFGEGGFTGSSYVLIVYGLLMIGAFIIDGTPAARSTCDIEARPVNVSKPVVAVGAGIGVLMKLRQPMLIWISAALLTVTVVMCFICFSKAYSIPAGNDPAALLHGFEERHALTVREAEVFGLIVGGRSNSEIAAALFVSESTVKFHVKNILKKTRCANRAELISKFRRDCAN